MEAERPPNGHIVINSPSDPIETHKLTTTSTPTTTPEHKSAIRTNSHQTEGSSKHKKSPEGSKANKAPAKTDSLEVVMNKPRSLSARAESPEKPKSNTGSKQSPEMSKPRSMSTNKSTPKKNEEAKKEDTAIPAPWVLSELTDEQKEQIKQFRNGPAAEFIDPEENDLQIIRWITARKGGISEASKMYIETKKWRKTENIDTITDWIQNIKSFKFLSEYWPISILPGKNSPKLRTHDGYLVIYERLTDVHPDILDIVTLDDMVKFHLYIQELCSKELKRLMVEEKDGSAYAGIVYVYDLSSLTMNHLSRANYHMFQVFNSYDANNYPETLRRVFLINAPPVFTMCWKVAKKIFRSGDY